MPRPRLAAGDYIPEIRFPDIELSEKRLTLTFDTADDARLFQRWLSKRSGSALSGWAAFGDFVDSQ